MSKLEKSLSLSGGEHFEHFANHASSVPASWASRLSIFCCALIYLVCALPIFAQKKISDIKLCFLDSVEAWSRLEPRLAPRLTNLGSMPLTSSVLQSLISYTCLAKKKPSLGNLKVCCHDGNVVCGFLPHTRQTEGSFSCLVPALRAEIERGVFKRIIIRACAPIVQPGKHVNIKQCLEPSWSSS